MTEFTDPPVGYLDAYDKVRTWHHELHEMMGELRLDLDDSSREALSALSGVMYLVEAQLVSDADGAN